MFDIYCNYKNAEEIWDLLHKKYIVEDAGNQKYAIGNFSNFQMNEEKDVSSQIHDFHILVNDLKNEEITLPETFIAGFLIERLPESWKDYKNNLKHKRKHMTLEDVIVHIRIEEKNRLRDKASLAKEFATKANLIEGGSSKPQSRSQQNFKGKNNNSKFNKNKANRSIQSPTPPSFKKKGNCYVCGRPGHYASQCKFRKEPLPPPKANLVENNEDIIAAVVSQVLLAATSKDWIIDSGATRHICGDRNAFNSYTPLNNGEEQVFMGDSSAALVVGKGKVLLKLTSGKTLSLSDVLHVPNIRANLVSVALLSKVGIKLAFESDKIVMTKNGMFIGKGYCNQGLFILNILNVANGNASTSFAYMVDSIDLWHARLGHVNMSYV